jgi:hypothetical protein
MGTVIRVKCSDCGLDKTFRVGSGMQFNNLEKVLPLFDKNTAEKITEYLNGNSGCLWYVVNNIGFCPECGQFSVYPVFYSTSREGKDIFLYSDCECGKRPVLLDIETVLDGTKEIPCPKCNNNLIISPEGIWD